MRKSLPLLLTVFTALLAFNTGSAQNKARISGHVYTNDGKPAPYVNLVLSGLGKGTSSDDQGFFAFDGLPQGRHALSLSALGIVKLDTLINLESARDVKLDLYIEATSRELNTIVITGQKRRVSSATKMNVPLLDIPMSIQVIDQPIIQQQAVIDLKDIVRNVSGVNQTGSYNGGYQFFNSRGFDMNNWTNFRRNGTLLWNMGNHYADFYESVEFLKGPAAIIYGDVAPGGVMNFVTKKPLPYDYRRFEVKIGDYGLFRPAIDLGGPLNKAGNLLYRLNVSYEKSNSFRRVVNNETFMFAPSITWLISPSTSFNVEFNYKNDQRIGDPGVVSPDGTFEGLRKISERSFYGEREATYSYKNSGFFSQFKHRFNRNWSFQNTVSYTQTERTPLNVYLNNDADSLGNITRYQYFFKQRFSTWTAMVDFIGEYRTGAIQHKILVGADWVDDKIRMGGFLQEDIVGTINLYNPELGNAGLKALPQLWDREASFTKRIGVYVQDQISLLNDRVKILAGLRYNKYTSGTRYDNPADKPESYSELNEDPVVPRLGIVFKPQRNISVYGSYSRSYEVNGPDWIDPSIIVPPTRSKQFEVGLKSDLLGQRLGITLAAFLLQKKDVYNWGYSDEAPTDFEYIAWTPNDGSYYTYLAKEHRSRGLELDINGKVTDNLNVLVSASYIQAEIVDDVVYPKGNWLANQPRTMFSTWLNYRFSGKLKGLSAGYGLFYKGKFYGDNSNDNGARVPSNYTMDVSAAYDWKQLRLQVNVSNFTNRVSYLGGFGIWEPQWTRRAVMTIAYRF